ncbi:hypothetical protein E2562_017907 [Oryza meyeriana var. granulata]|uniref:Uncharacterized protein n=1 Tax=Oryza meyeriana var. granulata TaxID=110450 RepID=A0A6G1CPW1_9ORYZ|nr:hypothetical protein E2562_017907 [Oryza meyeriana var. granulata]
MDDSCRRAGAIPFKWEICPGTPKHTRSASAAAAVAVAPAPPLAKVATKQLALPPCMTSPCASPSPYYHSPRLSSAACRSASVSPCRRRYGGAHRPRPTAFLDLAPRATTPEYAAAAVTRDADDETASPAAAAYGCFPLPLLRRKGSSKKRGGGGGYSSGSGSSSSGSFRSEPGGLRRSTSSSFSFPRGNRRLAESSRQQEVEAASGSWFF